MAKKILNAAIGLSPIGAIGKLVLGGKKKKAEAVAAPAAPKKGPIITQLGASSPARAPIIPRRGDVATILSDRLGG